MMAEKNQRSAGLVYALVNYLTTGMSITYQLVSMETLIVEMNGHRLPGTVLEILCEWIIDATVSNSIIIFIKHF